MTIEIFGFEYEEEIEQSKYRIREVATSLALLDSELSDLEKKLIIG